MSGLRRMSVSRFSTVRIDTSSNQQNSPEYLAGNPKADCRQDFGHLDAKFRIAPLQVVAHFVRLHLLVRREIELGISLTSEAVLARFGGDGFYLRRTATRRRPGQSFTPY